MRRLIALLLLLLLPLQFAWAAAGTYCQHESGDQSWHFGHHAHLHDDEPADAPSGTHSDCASCQFKTKSVAQDLPVQPTTAVAQSRPDTRHLLPATSPPSRIDRPKWAGLA